MRRRIFRLLLGGLLVAGAILATLVVAVSYGWQRDWLRREFETRLTAALQTPVSIGAFEGALHREVTLRALRVGEPSAPVLEIEALRVQFATPRLAGTPTLVFSRIELERPRLQLRRGLDGRWPWEAADERTEALGFAVAIDSFALAGGNVEIADGAGESLRVTLDGTLEDARLGSDFAIGELGLSFELRRSTDLADGAIAGSLEASYTSGGFASLAFRAAGPGFDAALRGSGTAEAIEQATLSVRVASIDAFDELLLGNALAVSGSISIAAELRGPPRWPIGTIVVDAADIRTEDRELGALRLEAASEKSGTLRVDALRLSGGPLEVTAEPGAELVADAERIVLRGLALRGNGGESRLDIELEAAFASLQGLDALLRDAGTRVEVRAKSWSLGAFAPLWHAAGVELAGVLDADLALAGAASGPQLRGSAQLRAGDIRTTDVEVRGVQIGVDVDAIPVDPRGSMGWPTGSVVVDAAAIRTEGRELGALRLEAASEKSGRLRIDALRLSGGPFEVTAEPGAELVADAERITLHGLALRGNGGMSRLEIELEAAFASLQGLDALLRDAGTRVGVRATSWTLGAFAPFWHAAGVDLSGVLDADLALTGAASGPQLRGSAQLRSGGIRIAEVEASGAQIDVEIEGTPSTSRAIVRASARAVRSSDVPLGALRAAIEIVDLQTAEIREFRLRGGPASLDVAAGARLRAARGGVSFSEFDLTLDGQRLAISGWVSAASAEGLRVTFPALDAAGLIRIANAFGQPAVALQVAGALGGHLAWDGPIEDPTLDGAIDWSDARLGGLQFDRIAIGVDTRRGAVQVESHWAYEGKTALDAELSLPADRIFADPASLLDDPRTSLRARADGFELAAVSRFLPRSITGLGGSLTAELRATGGRFPANASGELEIERGSLELRGLGGQTLSPILVRASLSGDRIRLDEFQIGEAGARVHGTGKLALPGGPMREIDLHLAFENFAIDAPGLVKGRLDGPVDLTGTAGAPALRGALELSGLRVQIPEPDAVEIKEIRVYSTAEDESDVALREGEAATALLDPLRLDLEIAVRKNSWARGRGAEVELQGDLEAKKDPRGTLSLSGAFKAVRGTYEIYGRRFRIDRGEVVLDGAAEVDPVLDVRAEHRVRGVKIFALLEGRLSEPTLRFESEPELSETDIASYLFLGRPADAVGSGEQPALDAAAAQIAAGAALSEFERLFGGDLPVDMLDVRMEGNGDETEVRAGVGKYIGERLFLHYERGFGEESEDELTAEYELTPNWSVESTITTDNDAGADLIFEAEN